GVAACAALSLFACTIGGAAGAGGTPGSGGGPASGWTTGSRGSSTGGASGAGGSGTTCALPSKFTWTSSGPLAMPTAPAGKTWVALKDFSDVVMNGVHVVY